MSRISMQIGTARKVTAIALLLVFIFPLSYKPAHYFIFEHAFQANSQNIEIHNYTEHFKCAIDHFQLTEILSHYIKYSFYVRNFCVLKSVFLVFVFLKNHISYHFLLRAPPTL